jgi:hypothetical protein
MTKEQFDSTKFKANMRAQYKHEYYMILSVDFEERILGIYSPDNKEDIKYVRCENMTLVE